MPKGDILRVKFDERIRQMHQKISGHDVEKGH